MNIIVSNNLSRDDFDAYSPYKAKFSVLPILYNPPALPAMWCQWRVTDIIDKWMEGHMIQIAQALGSLRSEA